ncbi:MAG TPA: hypothetical protein VFB07_07550 [Vicinamibacterales bacterium]|nr:hypothetical protein [Vicinamibacterales bacterium]
MRRVVNDAMLSAGALVALGTLLVALDSRVREHVMRVGSGGGAADLSALAGQVRELASVTVGVVDDAVWMHPALALFVVAATVLTVFMVRT